ncbi:hypothetical protein RIVM261_044760 [Rivularia sp. IAM M-261]|nr:hypothetical protein RIVM261_044760 [Rivularia sp. IAM M-261]
MKNFYLTVYAYDLYRNSSESINANALSLWDSLVNLGNTSFPFQGLKDLKSNLLSHDKQNKKVTRLLTTNQEILDLGNISTEIGFRIQGKLAPFFLNNVSQIDLTLSAELPEQTEINLSHIKCFNPEGSLLNLKASLGQTIWIYAEVEEDDNYCQKLAENCVKELLSGTQFTSELVNSNYDSIFDKLFDSLIFEFKVKHVDELTNSTVEIQILISLNNSQNSSLYKFAETSEHLLNLLYFYHRLKYLNKQAKQLYPELRHLYNDLERKIDCLPKIISEKNTKIKLNKLKKLLEKSLPSSLRYSQKFRALQAQHTAIKTDIINYQTCVNEISALDNHTPILWQNFYTRCEHWQQQIQIHIEYFAPGQDSFQKVTDAISGFLRIKQIEYDRETRDLLRKREEEQRERDREAQDLLRKRDEQEKERDRKREQQQKKRDRKLENTIQSVGFATAVGSSAGGILASTYQVSPYFAKNILKIQSEDKDATLIQNGSILGFSFATSIIAGILFGLVAMFLTKLVLDRSDKKELKQEQKLPEHKL